MSILKVKAALEVRLSALSPALPTVFDNNGYSPVAGVPYQRINLIPGKPDNSIQGASAYFERGTFQVMLCYPLGGGSSLALTRAELTRNHFKRGTTLPLAPIQVIVMETPTIAVGLIDGDRYCIPISIIYQAKIEVT